MNPVEFSDRLRDDMQRIWDAVQKDDVAEVYRVWGSRGVSEAFNKSYEEWKMKRMPEETFDQYRSRRSAENEVARAHLKGRVNGRYVDPALHNTMQRVNTRRYRLKNWLLRNYPAVLLLGLMGATGFALMYLFFKPV